MPSSPFAAATTRKSSLVRKRDIRSRTDGSSSITRIVSKPVLVSAGTAGTLLALWRRGIGRLDDDLDGQPDRKNGALANLALHPDVPLHHLNEAVSNGESQAGSPILPGNRRTPLAKLLKQVLLLLGREANPVVAD